MQTYEYKHHQSFNKEKSQTKKNHYIDDCD